VHEVNVNRVEARCRYSGICNFPEHHECVW
jgi:hypothetical protein